MLISRIESRGNQFLDRRLVTTCQSGRSNCAPIACGLAFAAILAAGGCDRTSPDAGVVSTPPAERAVATSVSANNVLQNVVRNYQSLDSYRDSASVVLEYNMDGVAQVDRAPLNVAWQRTGELGLRVYSLQAGPTSARRWHLRIDRPDLAPADQVLSRALPKQLDFDWLLSDAAIGTALAAGLAGFPPQLDLLLNERPLERLMAGATRMEFENPAVIDGRACHVIHIQHGTLDYLLFIDKATMLLTRLDLPIENLPPAVLQATNVTEPRLYVDFQNVQTEGGIDWTEFRVPVGEQDVLVNRFVPAAEEYDTRLLGQRVPAFRMKGPSGQVVVDTQENRRQQQIYVLMWLADHPTCRVAAEQLSAIAAQVEKQPHLARSIRFVPVWAQPRPPTGKSFDALVTEWGLPGKLAIDSDALGRDLFQIEQAPSLVVLAADHTIQLRESSVNPYLEQVLPGLLQRIVDGEDLPRELQREAAQNRVRFAAELSRSLAVDQLVRSSPKWEQADQAYPPVSFQLTPVHSYRYSSELVAATTSKRSPLWTLHADGNLFSRSPKGDARKEYTTQWQRSRGNPSSTSPVQIVIDDQETYVASNHSANQVDVFRVDSNIHYRFPMAAGSNVTSMTWLTWPGTQTGRLAALSNTRELVLLDPTQREQYRGQCSSKPIAVFPRSTSDTEVEWLVALEDGSANRLVVDSARSGTDTLAKPVHYSSGGGANLIRDSQIAFPFEPSAGPWSGWLDGPQNLLLSHGWVAKDEAALFLLDGQLNTIWKYRVGLGEHAIKAPASVATDPNTGLAVWVAQDGGQSIHLIRADGLTDHFRPSESDVVCPVLIAEGNALYLHLLGKHEATAYRVAWH